MGRLNSDSSHALRHTPDQKALKELVNARVQQAGTLLTSEVKAVDSWAKETSYPGHRASSKDLAGEHWNGPHIHLPGAGKGGHIPIASATSKIVGNP